MLRLTDPAGGGGLFLKQDAIACVMRAIRAPGPLAPIYRTTVYVGADQVGVMEEGAEVIRALGGSPRMVQLEAPDGSDYWVNPATVTSIHHVPPGMGAASYFICAGQKHYSGLSAEELERALV